MNAMTVRESSHDFEQTVDRIERAIRDSGNTLFARIDQAAAARSAGLELRPTVVLLFGNPKVGTALMGRSPAFALDLPLKVVVWHDDDGPVKVAYRSLRTLAESNPIPGEDDVLKALDARLAALVDTARQ